MRHSDNYNRWRKCYHCNESFQEKNNIGQLYCRIHPGIIFISKNDDNNNRYYSCCGVRVDSCQRFFMYNNIPFISQYDPLGCLKIDHFDKEYLMEKILDDEELFSKTDISKRIEQIKLLSIIAVSNQLYKYGVSKPRKECIIDSININNCYQLYNNTTNYFKSNQQIKIYNLDISKNALYSHHIHFINPDDNDNIQIDLIPVCQQIDNMLDLNKDYQKELIDNIWNDNITTTNEDITLIDNLKKTINDEVPRNFQMVKRIDTELLYNYYGLLKETRRGKTI